MNRTKNAYRGRNIEVLFRNSIGDNSSVISILKNSFSIEGNYRTCISSGIHAEKRDVTLEFTCGRNIDANIKSYGEMGYNQLTRTSIENFCKKFKLPHYKWLENLFLNKARNTRSKLFPDIEQEKARNILEPIVKEIVKWSISAKASREILVLFDNDQNLFRIYKMQNVLNNIGYKIDFTVKGNLIIGDYIVFQRKGGNGIGAAHLRKDDIRHPGNNVQLKMKMNKFVEGMEQQKIANYRV